MNLKKKGSCLQNTFSLKPLTCYLIDYKAIWFNYE